MNTKRKKKRNIQRALPEGWPGSFDTGGAV
jgi:hypothetical protein